MIYRVECQNGSGHKTTITVRADSDEKACAAASRILNSWKPVRALSPREAKPEVAAPTAPPILEPATRHDAGRGGLRIIHKAGPRDWINTTATPKTNVARAFVNAAREGA